MIKPGLNIHGYYTKCRREVISNLGFDSKEIDNRDYNDKAEFDIWYLVDCIPCPICKSYLDEDSIDKLFICERKYKIIGRFRHIITDNELRQTKTYIEFDFADGKGKFYWQSLSICIYKL